MASPYRVAAEVSEPADRVATIRLRRFPVVVQVFLLAWFPAAMLFAAKSIPDVRLACDRADIGGVAVCRLDEKSAFAARSNAVAPAEWMVEHAAQNGRASLIVHTAAGDRSFRIDGHNARSISTGFRRFVVETEPGRFERSVHDGRFAHLALCVAEAALVLFLAFGQRRIRVDVNADAGRLRIEERRLLRAPVIRDIDLRHVHGFHLDELSDAAKTQHVSASMLSGKKKRLFSAVPGEARRGATFLAEQLAAWSDRQDPWLRVSDEDLAHADADAAEDDDLEELVVRRA